MSLDQYKHQVREEKEKHQDEVSKYEAKKTELIREEQEREKKAEKLRRDAEAEQRRKYEEK